LDKVVSSGPEAAAHIDWRIYLDAPGSVGIKSRLDLDAGLLDPEREFQKLDNLIATAKPDG